ncbi:MAG: hypothetical protein ACPKPY_08225, partial [Nitrososphaeraceae archaeon]
EEESLQITSSSKTADHIPKFLAVQHAQSGSISEINETAYLLELNDVSEKTVLFSDRPDRIVTSENTSDFIGNWSIGSNSFAIDAPNTIIVTDVDSNEQDVAIIELFNPVYDSDKKTLMYEVTLDNTTSYNLSGEFGQTTLILDDHCSSPWDPRGC